MVLMAERISSGGLIMIYNAIQKALEADDALPSDNKCFYVREFNDWRIWGNAIERVLTERKIAFAKISWE